MPVTKTPKIRIPAKYRNHGSLVAISEEEHQQLKDRLSTEKAHPTQRKKTRADWKDRIQTRAIPLDAPVTKKEIAAWKQFIGMWKGRKLPDAAKWQRRIRKEWDRPLP